MPTEQTGPTTATITGSVTVDTEGTLGGGTEAAALRVTIATDSTGVLSVDDNGSTISIDDGAGAISVDDNGGSLTVDVGTALPAGTNAIGKLAANSGVDIGDVDVTSIIPGTAATSLGKAEDDAHNSGDVGVMALAVQKATPADLGADGDYSPIQMSGGYLWARVGGTVAHDTADSGNPLKVGGKVRSVSGIIASTPPANLDRVDASFDSLGRLLTVSGSPSVGWITNNSADITNNSEFTIRAAPAPANSQFCVTDITICNSHGTVSTWVKVLDGSGGTVKYQFYAAAAGGAVAKTFATPLLFTEATAIIGICETTGSNVRVSLQGYIQRAS